MTKLMQRLRHIILKYRPSLAEDAWDFLLQSGRIRHYSKGNTYKLASESRHNWCLVLDGLVVKQNLDPGGRVSIERIAPPNIYFVGTRHIYTSREETQEILFWQDTVLFEIHNSDFRHAVQTYPDISELYHVLKQRKLDIANDLMRIHSVHFKFRLYEMARRFPALIHKLTVEQKKQLLRISNNRDYYTANTYMLRHL